MLGLLLSILTFPGVMVHEMAHVVFCHLQGVEVHKACYFRLGNPAGYVVHDEPDSLFKDVLIGIGPLFVNSLAGAIIGLPGATDIMKHQTGSLNDYILLWLGISIAMHSFPSTGDARSIWRGLWSRPASILARLAGIPVVGLIYLGALGSSIKLNWLWGAGVVLLFPRLIVWLLTTLQMWMK